MNFLMVALGGAVGATGRYAISLLPVRSAFPVLTLITNVLGALLIGFAVGWTLAKPDVSENSQLFLKTGVCGGFTTFSTFSLEALTLLDEGRVGLSITYMCLSMILCIVGVYVGRMLGSRI